MVLPHLISWSIIIITIDFLNAVLSAVHNAEAQYPRNPRSTFFSAVFYKRPSGSPDRPYRDLIIFCAATLVSHKWVLTISDYCEVQPTWRILVGVREIPRGSIHRQKNYGVKRIVDSLESFIRLVEMDRNLQDIATEPAKIVEFSPGMNCFVAAWMSAGKYKIRMNKEEHRVSLKLHCNFNPTSYKDCKKYVGNYSIELQEDDICLLQKNENNPVALCKFDVGAPVVCNGSFVGMVNFITNVGETESGDCIGNEIGNFYPVITVNHNVEWIKFLTKMPKSKSLSHHPLIVTFLNTLLVFSVS